MRISSPRIPVIASLATIALTALTAGCASPGPTETFSQTYMPVPGSKLVIENDNGATVVVGDDSESATRAVQVDATLVGADDIDFNVEEGTTELKITAKAKSHGLFQRSPKADIHVTVPRGMPVKVTSGNGKVEVTGVEAAADATTGNGSITIDAPRGDVSASSGNGSITVSDGRGSFRLTSGNGSITLKAELLSGGTSSVTTGNGTVDISLQGGPDVAIDAETDNGKISSSLQLTSTERSDSKHLKGSIGTGSASLTARAGNGSINLR